jgi:histidine triad (HIT) family protein
MKDCLFCKIARKEIPATIIAETEHCLAFRDIAPQAPVHVLVIPKTHFGSLDSVPSGEVVGQMAEVAQKVARDLGVASSGYRTVLNTHDDGGQTVHHIHMHVLGGRRMTWPPG